jgi:hypothetical protein
VQKNEINKDGDGKTKTEEREGGGGVLFFLPKKKKDFLGLGVGD